MLDVNLNETWDTQPELLKNEIFLSWFTRLAKDNYSDTDLLFQRFLPQKNKGNLMYQLENLNTNVIMQNQLIEKFKSYIQVPFIPLKNELTVEDKEFNFLNEYSKNVMYCPYCLLKDDIPYFRTTWQLNIVCVCNIHQIILLENCLHCYSPIKYWRTDYTENIDTCYVCKLKITDFIISPIKIDLSQNEIQCKLNEIYTKEKFQNSKIAMSSIELFQNLWKKILKKYNSIGLELYLQSDNISNIQLFSAIVSVFDNVINSPKIELKIDDRKDHQLLIQNLKIEKLIELQINLSEDKAPDKIAAFRYEVVILLLKIGTTKKSVDRVAKSLQISSGTIWRWIKKYRQFSTVESLIPQHYKSGRHKKFKPDILNKFVKHCQDTNSSNLKSAYLEVSTQISSEIDIPSYATVRRYYNKIKKSNVDNHHKQLSYSSKY